MAYGTAGQTQNVVINSQFLQLKKGWLVTDGWAHQKDPIGIKHTAGITTLSQNCTLAEIEGATYVIDVYVSGITAGTLTVTTGSGATGAIISADGWHTWEEEFVTTTQLVLTPTTDFDGVVRTVRVRAKK